MIAEEVVRRVRESTDLARLIGEYLPLRRAGGAWVARCPFHEERSPSFSVNGARGFYFCFGCKAAGDAFSFLVQHEGMDFPEAVRHLGERLGIEVEPERWQVLQRQAALARGFGVEVQLITPQEAGNLYPLLRTDDLQGAQFVIKNPNATTTCGCGSSFSA